MTRSEQKLINEKNQTQWAKICQMAEQLLKDIPQKSYYHELVHTNEHDPRGLFPLLEEIKKSGLWETFSLRNQNYGLGLISKIFNPALAPLAPTS